MAPVARCAQRADRTAGQDARPRNSAQGSSSFGGRQASLPVSAKGSDPVAIPQFGEFSRPRRRVRRRLVQTFDLAGARRRLPLVRAVLAEIALRRAEVARGERRCRTAPPSSPVFATRDTAQSAWQAACREARRLGLRLLPGAAAFPTIVNGALAYFVLLGEDDDIYSWRYRNDPRRRPIPAAWYVDPPARTLDLEPRPT